MRPSILLAVTGAEGGQLQHDFAYKGYPVKRVSGMNEGMALLREDFYPVFVFNAESTGLVNRMLEVTGLYEGKVRTIAVFTGNEWSDDTRYKFLRNAGVDAAIDPKKNSGHVLPEWTEQFISFGPMSVGEVMGRRKHIVTGPKELENYISHFRTKEG